MHIYKGQDWNLESSSGDEFSKHKGNLRKYQH